MATITFQVSSLETGNRTKNFTVSEENFSRLLIWAKVRFKKPDETEITNNQALARWADWAMEQTRSAILNHERDNTLTNPFEAV